MSRASGGGSTPATAIGCRDRSRRRAARWSRRRARRAAGAVGGPGRQHRRGAAGAGAARRRARCRHRPDLGARSAARLHPGGLLAGAGGRAAGARSRPATRRGCSTRWSRTCARCWRCSARGAVVVRLRQQPARARWPIAAACATPSTSRGSCPAYIRPLFCRGAGPFRWVALSGDPADIAATDDAVLETFPDKRAARALDPAGAGEGAVPGPAGAHLLAGVRRARRDGAQRSTGW